MCQQFVVRFFLTWRVSALSTVKLMDRMRMMGMDAATKVPPPSKRASGGKEIGME